MDFVVFPKGLLSEVVRCKTLITLSCKTWSVNTKQLCDHAPIVMRWNLDVVAQPKQGVLWDRDSLIEAVLCYFSVRDVILVAEISSTNA